MADFLRFLPLSGRGHDDERTVTADRRRELDALVVALTPLLEGPDTWRQFATDAGLRREWTAAGGDVAAFRVGIGARTRSIRALAKAFAAGLRAAVGRDLTIDPMTAGAVALYAQGAGPFARRAVVAGHTVRATDADWAFGTGPVLEGRSVQIAGFLLGVTDIPPHPPTSDPGAADTRQ